MRLKIIETNFTDEHEWLFQLSDGVGNLFYIMAEPFYKNNGLKSPITKRELDYYDKGQWIGAAIKEIAGKNIVVQ